MVRKSSLMCNTCGVPTTPCIGPHHQLLSYLLTYCNNPHSFSCEVWIGFDRGAEETGGRRQGRAGVQQQPYGQRQRDVRVQPEAADAAHDRAAGRLAGVARRRSGWAGPHRQGHQRGGDGAGRAAGRAGQRGDCGGAEDGRGHRLALQAAQDQRRLPDLDHSHPHLHPHLAK